MEPTGRVIKTYLRTLTIPARERCANNVEFLDRFKCALLCGSLSACVDIRNLTSEVFNTRVSRSCC